MGGNEREARHARAAYLGSVLNLARSMTAFAEADVPLAPDPDGAIQPWTTEHVTVMRACAEAWPAVVDRRREYDAVLRMPTA